MIKLEDRVVILDSDRLSKELLDISLDSEQTSFLFIWDEELHKRRFFSQKRQEFIYEVLAKIDNIVVVYGKSGEVLKALQTRCPHKEFLYTSRYADRFAQNSLKHIRSRFNLVKVEPLPRGFFPFFKKCMKVNFFR